MGNAFNSFGEVQPSVYLIHGFGGLGRVSMVCSLGVHPKGLGKVPRIKKRSLNLLFLSKEEGVARTPRLYPH